MRALPPETAFRTDTSLLWMAMVAVVTAQKDKVLSQIPSFPRRLVPYDTSRLARLIQQTLESGFAHPSRLLAYYLERLTRLKEPDARPLTDLEILWQLAEELSVPMYEEEAQCGEALAQAAEAVWLALHASPDQYAAFLRTPPDLLANDTSFDVLVRQMLTTDVDGSQAQFIELLRDVVGWLQAPVPAVRALIQVLEHTQIHTFLTANADLALAYPGYLTNTKTLVDLHTLLSSALRPTMLRHGELLSPMEATIYHQPEPGAPPFVEIGGEVSVGQTIALLEAMKMFSELPSPVDGIVEAILVESGQGVKTGEPLFKIATQDVAVESTLDYLPQLASNGFQNHFLLLE
jgi:biotin carboxyl carrier protein